MKDATADKKVVQVKMFGDFKIVSNDVVITEDAIRSPMVTKLLAFVVYNYKKMISVQELGESLWSEEETDNQVGALKNLMYRLRNVLKKFLGDSDFILTGQSSYYWNVAVSVELDCEVFEKLCSMVKPGAGKKVEEQIAAGEKAVAMYDGDFLPKFSSEHWVIPINTYYHSLYLTMVKNLAELYKEHRQYEDMENICQKAVALDSLDEYLNCLMIEALSGQHKEKMALKYYENVVKLLYENLGVKPSKRLQEVYNTLMREVNDQEMNLRTIQKDLKEAIKPSGVFLCEYGVFREMYRLQARQAERFGMSVFIILFTIVPPSYIEKGSEAYLAMVTKAMEQLKVALHLLRAGDVAAKFSGAQYVVMLPTCTFETAKKVVDRVEAKFYSDKKWNKYDLNYSLEAIDFPVEN